MSSEQAIPGAGCLYLYKRAGSQSLGVLYVALLGKILLAGPICPPMYVCLYIPLCTIILKNLRTEIVLYTLSSFAEGPIRTYIHCIWFKKISLRPITPLIQSLVGIGIPISGRDGPFPAAHDITLSSALLLQY